MQANNLFTDKKFWPLFWTQFLGAFNDNVFKNAIVIMITYKSMSIGGLPPQQLVAMCSAIFILPFFLFSATAGQISDKIPKNQLMLWVKYWELGVMAVGTIGFLSSNLVLLLIALFFMGMHSTFFGPAKYSALPEILEREELVKGNAFIDAGTFMAILLGTILGGILIGSGDRAAHYVSGTVLLVAVFGIMTAHKIKKLPAYAPKLHIDWGIVKPTRKIIAITKEIKSIKLSVLAISWFWFFGAAVLTMIPIYVKDVIRFNEQVVTFFMALFSIGVAVGSILCEKMSKKRLELGLVPLGTIGMVIFTFDFSIADLSVFSQATANDFRAFIAFTQGKRIAVDLFLLAVFSGFFIVPLYTFIQQRSEPEKCSRVIAGNNIMNSLFMVVSALWLSVMFALKFTIPQIITILAVLNMLVGIYVYNVIPEFMLRLYCLLIARFVYRTRVTGDENIPHDGPALLICNHVSFVDWLVISALINRPIRFVMHHEFTQIPFLKGFFKRGKVIPITGAKENPKILEEALHRIEAELRDGELVCIFPEGTITKTGAMNPFRPGVEVMAKKVGVSVIPMALNGLWGTFTSRAYNQKACSNPWIIPKTMFSKVSLTIAKPVPAAEVSAPELQKTVQAMLNS